MPFALQGGHEIGLVLRRHPGAVVPDACVVGYPCGSGGLVAREHIDFDAHGL